MKEPIHLDDGAYATLNDCDELILTANHHDPALASDAVVLSRFAFKMLCDYLRDTHWYPNPK